MIPTIVTNKEMIIKTDDRSVSIVEKGIVEIQISKIIHDLNDDSRVFIVEDFLVMNASGDLNITERDDSNVTIRRKLKQIDGRSFKEVIKTKEEYEQMLAYFTQEYPELSYSEKCAYGLLAETQGNLIYKRLDGTLSRAEDWQIK